MGGRRYRECGAVKHPDGDRCRLPTSHEGYHQAPGVRWLGYNGPTMDIHAACAGVLGDEAAHAITMGQGLHWTIVAAMAVARTPKHDREVVVIRAYNAEARRQPA